RGNAVALVELGFSLSGPSCGVALCKEAPGLLGKALASDLSVVFTVSVPDSSHVYTSVVPQVCQGMI
ncbi:MAG: hypothetical protein QF767_18665, partial [Alphaproteobacteria bacterium]|nr:hypothetical protein [Alphaproteobacteria bacterium]